jgi:hypothetical protein
MERPLGTVVVGGPLFRFTREVADGTIPAIKVQMDVLNQHARMFPAVPIVSF